VRGNLEHDTLFADRYRVIAPLGEGAMGRVWRVFDQQREAECALKLLKPELGHADDLDRFKREFRAMARLDHPHCTRCLESGLHHGQAFFTMEYVAGGSLSLERWDDPAAVVDLGRQLLAGLDHIHARGIIHRDIKPQNIFVEHGPQGLHARLGDLGIVRVADFVDEGAGVGDVLGSLRFLAPETLEHGMADPRSDLYALGLLLYCLLDGEHPLGEGKVDARRWLALHRKGHMRGLDRADIPASLIEVVHRMCDRRPEARYPSAAHAYDALEEVRAGMGAWPWTTLPLLERSPHLAAPAFVGRSAELQRAQGFCSRSLEGREGACVLSIEGAAGLGKSRLMRELLVDALVVDDVVVFVGTCPAEGGSPYRPLSDLMRALDRVGDDPFGALKSAQTVTRRSQERTAERTAERTSHPSASASDDPTVKVQELDEGTAVHSETSEPSEPSFRASDGLSPEDQALARLHFHDRMADQLVELCASRRVLVVVDDAQWADPPTLQLLSSMARAVSLSRRAGNAWRVGFIVTHRPVAPSSRLAEFREAMASAGTSEVIELGPLSDAAATELVASMLMLPAHEVPEQFAGPLLAKAEGSPLFLSQMMRLLLGKGMLAVDERGRWRLDEQLLDTAALPVSVSTAIGERASRLATPSKQLLAAAAVVGRSFDLGIVSALVDEDELVILDGLDELVRAEFVEDVPGGVRFVHDRIRESIYEGLPERSRMALHAAAAVALLARDRHRPETWPGIAHHYEQAGNHEQAYRFALRAANHASAEYAHGAAEQMYALALRAAERSDTIEVDSKVWERRGDACAAVARYEDAVQCYQRRLEATPSVVDKRVVLSKVGTLEYKRGRFTHAVAAMEKVLDLAGFVPPRSGLAVRLRTLGQAVLVLLPARPWTGAAEDGDARARTFALTAESWYFAGDQARTIYYSMASANTARRVGPSPGSVRALSGFGYSLTIFGLHRVGGYFSGLARQYSEACKMPDNDACWQEVMAGLILATQGRSEHALAVFDDASRRFDDSPNSEARLLSFINHTLIRSAAGRDLPRVARICAQMQHLADETNDTRAKGWAGEARGQLALRRGELDEGFPIMRDASAWCLEANDMAFASSINDTLALFLALEGEHTEALERGQLAAEAVLAGQLRHYFPVDGGLVVAAAMAKQQGVALPTGVDALVRRVLRSRRWVVWASKLTELRYLLGRAAWRVAHGRAADFEAIIARAEGFGFFGEALVGRRVAAAFDPERREHHLAAAHQLQARFEHD